MGMSKDILMDELILQVNRSEFEVILKQFDIEPTNENIDKYFRYTEQISQRMQESLKNQLHWVAQQIAEDEK